MVLNKVVTPLNPDIVFVFFGANDAIDPSVKQYIPLEQFTHNIRLIILELKSVIFISFKGKLPYFRKNYLLRS